MDTKKSMHKLTHGSLFSGIGGFDLAAEWIGWENVFHCEINEFGRTVLNYYWPNAQSHKDIIKTDFTIYRGRIFCLSGGFPCQPFSVAGKRRGTEDNRHLWPEFLRAIREIQPRYVVGENVRGLIDWNHGLVFEQVQIDLENAGYEVLPVMVPACAVNAPHRRERIWFVAYATSNSREQKINKRPEYSSERGEIRDNFNTNVNKRFTSNTDGVRHDNSERTKGDYFPSEHAKDQEQPRNRRRGEFIRSSQGGNVTDTNGGRLEWRRTLGKLERNRLSKCYPQNHESEWKDFPTEPPVCSGNDGVSSGLDGIRLSKWRNETLKAAGNAVVPQIVYKIFKAIHAIETDKKKSF